MDFLQLGGSLTEYDPKWRKAYLELRVAELEQRRLQEQLRLAEVNRELIQRESRPNSRLEKGFQLVAAMLYIFAVVFSFLAGAHWVVEELFGGQYFAAIFFLVLVVVPVLAFLDSR
jgi:hypothetical protein